MRQGLAQSLAVDLDPLPAQEHKSFAAVEQRFGFFRRQFLVAQGMPEERLSAVGLADTRLRDPGSGKASHRRNRRIEIHLTYGSLPPS